jgi:hypothetical protein
MGTVAVEPASVLSAAEITEAVLETARATVGRRGIATKLLGTSCSNRGAK